MLELFKSYGIEITEDYEKSFLKYADLLIEYNQKVNITAITDRREIYIKHFLDSVIFYKDVVGDKLIDIGSGGGFPALPLKIIKPELKVTLVEATGKKCEFLRYIVKELDLKDVTVLNARAEDLAKDDKYREKFEICTARAVAGLNTLCEYCMPFVKKGGLFLAYKGNAEEEINSGKNAIKILGGKLLKTEEREIEGAKRTLVVIKKESLTPLKYPRGNGKEKKNPL